jgi:predicted site-specific integrase-resolvase
VLAPQPPGVRRGMSGEEAANLYGLSRSAFQKARQEGRIPRPTLPGKRYDRILLEMEMNKLSGIVENESKPLDEWRKRNGSN